MIHSAYTVAKEIFNASEAHMNRSRSVVKVIGISMLSFGCGILSSFFLPETALIVIESVVIIGVGLIYFSCK